MRRVLPVTALLLASATLVPTAQQSARPAPQQPGLTFRATANFVEVDAIVTDKAGEPARDLTCEDFHVTEDGKPQNLSVCAFVDIPVDRPDPPLFKDRIVEPDVVTNEKTFDGRIFMIVLDGFHVSASRGLNVRREAEKFIDRYMGENDIASVVQVGNPSAGQEFTSNKRLLKSSIQRFAGQSLPSITASINKDAMAKNNQQFVGGPDPGPPVDTEAQVREYMARQSMDTIRRLSEYLADLSGRRKAVLLFSEGIGIDFLQPPQLICSGCPTPANLEPVRMSQRDMVSAASRSNVSIYSIDPRGLTSGMEDVTPIGGIAAAPEEGSTLRNYSNPALPSDMQTEVNRAQDSLREFAEATGGLAMVNKNDMDDAFRRIIKDNSSYYVLGYQSADPRHDGRFHRVQVKVKRPGLQVRTRSGYSAPSDKPGAKPVDAVVQLLRSPAPVGGLGIRANASIIKGLMLKSTVHLTLEFSGKDFPLKPSGSLFTNEIEIEYLALDMKGVSQAGARQDANVKLRPASKDALAETGIRAILEFELAPGRYQLRVAAREKLTGRKGSVFADLDVPDLGTVRLGMSDLLITASKARRTPTPNNMSTIGKLLPTATIASRTFNTTDTLTVAASVYDNDGRAPHRVDLKATVHSDAGAQLFLKEEIKESATMTGAKGGSSWVVEIPLKELAPGRYVLAFEANSRLKEVDPVRKEVEIVVK